MRCFVPAGIIDRPYVAAWFIAGAVLVPLVTAAAWCPGVAWLVGGARYPGQAPGGKRDGWRLKPDAAAQTGP